MSGSCRFATVITGRKVPGVVVRVDRPNTVVQPALVHEPTFQLDVQQEHALPYST